MPSSRAPIALVVQRALARSASALGSSGPSSAAFEATLVALMPPLCARLNERDWYGDTVVAPLPALLASVMRIVQREGSDVEQAVLCDAAYNVLSAAMRRRTALLATAQQGALLEQVTHHDVHLLRALAARVPHACMARCELRFETIRKNKILPRRLRLGDDPDVRATHGVNSSLRDASAATLEMLGLAAWTDTVIVPLEDPAFATAWRHLRLGTVSFVDGLRRWLAGQHMAPIRHEDRQQQNRLAVGGLEVSFRSFALTRDGHRMAQAMRTPFRRTPELVHRAGQPLDEGPLQHLHAVR